MLINNKLIEEIKVKELISKIKDKKELREINDDFVRNQLFDYLQQKPQVLRNLNNPKSFKYKLIIKEVRAKLRRVYGLFRIEEKIKERRELVETLLRSKLLKKKILFEILETHSSTKERIDFYEELYRKLWKIIGKPKKIIDLGCGINPFSIPLMGLRRLDYHAYDLSEEEVSLLNKFFQFLHKKNINCLGKSSTFDVLQLKKLRRLKEVDVCFLFKMTDVLDRGKGHKVTEELINWIPAKFIVVSFPTLTMSGKRMNYPRRRWIELMCKRLGYHYRTLEFSNELFYIIKK